jgi:hypothetical protein
MNDLIQEHNNKKSHSGILTGCVFDMQAYVSCVQQVFNSNTNTSPDFDIACDYLRFLSKEIRENITKVEEMIPAKKVVGEIS